jgi:hypothetical protein
MGEIAWSRTRFLANIDIEIHELSCTPLTADPTGAVSSGFIRFSGVVVPGKVHLILEDSERSSDGYTAMFSIDNNDICLKFFQDCLRLISNEQEDIATSGLWIGSNMYHEYLLILRQTSSTDATYQRVGISLDEKWRDSLTIALEKQEFTII